MTDRQEDSNASLSGSIAFSFSGGSQSNYDDEGFEEESTIVQTAHERHSEACVEDAGAVESGIEEETAYDYDAFENEADTNPLLDALTNQQKDDLGDKCFSDKDSLCGYSDEFEYEDDAFECDDPDQSAETRCTLTSEEQLCPTKVAEGTVVDALEAQSFRDGYDLNLYEKEPNQVAEQTLEVQMAKPELSQWYKEKLELLRTASCKAGDQSHSLLPTPDPPKLNDPAAVAHLIKIVKQHSQRRTDQFHQDHWSRGSSSKNICIPSTLLDNAKNQRFIARAAKINTEKEYTNRWKPPQKSLSTYCSTKTETLRAKLATALLESMCSKWMPPFSNESLMGPENDNGTLSIGVLQMMQVMAGSQRRILAAGCSDGGARGLQYGGRKLRMEARVAATKQQLQASAHIRQQAASVLGVQNA